MINALPCTCLCLKFWGRWRISPPQPMKPWCSTIRDHMTCTFNPSADIPATTVTRNFKKWVTDTVNRTAKSAKVSQVDWQNFEGLFEGIKCSEVVRVLGVWVWWTPVHPLNSELCGRRPRGPPLCLFVPCSIDFVYCVYVSLFNVLYVVLYHVGSCYRVVIVVRSVTFGGSGVGFTVVSSIDWTYVVASEWQRDREGAIRRGVSCRTARA